MTIQSRIGFNHGWYISMTYLCVIRPRIITNRCTNEFIKTLIKNVIKAVIDGPQYWLRSSATYWLIINFISTCISVGNLVISILHNGLISTPGRAKIEILFSQIRPHNLAFNRQFVKILMFQNYFLCTDWFGKRLVKLWSALYMQD